MQPKKMYVKNKYQYIGILSNTIRFKENELWGINDLDGNEILPLQFNEVFRLSFGLKLIAAREGSFWKIYNENGEEISSEKYDSLFPFYGMFGITKIKKGNKYGLLNKRGRKIIPISYQKIERFGSGLILHNFDSSIEFVDRKSLMHIPEISSDIYLDQIKEPAKSILQNRIPKKSKSY
ncbi:MAG: WG repeat-containing protein [Ignavibacteriae bacterium]|nr:WG repeat-containing protein [Ignavibacteriota bacterium]